MSSGWGPPRGGSFSLGGHSGGLGGFPGGRSGSGGTRGRGRPTGPFCPDPNEDEAVVSFFTTGDQPQRGPVEYYGESTAPAQGPASPPTQVSSSVNGGVSSSQAAASSTNRTLQPSMMPTSANPALRSPQMPSAVGTVSHTLNIAPVSNQKTTTQVETKPVQPLASSRTPNADQNDFGTFFKKQVEGDLQKVKEHKLEADKKLRVAKNLRDEADVKLQEANEKVRVANGEHFKAEEAKLEANIKLSTANKKLLAIKEEGDKAEKMREEATAKLQEANNIGERAGLKDREADKKLQDTYQKLQEAEYRNREADRKLQDASKMLREAEDRYREVENKLRETRRAPGSPHEPWAVDQHQPNHPGQNYSRIPRQENRRPYTGHSTRPYGNYRNEDDDEARRFFESVKNGDTAPRGPVVYYQSEYPNPPNRNLRAPSLAGKPLYSVPLHNVKEPCFYSPLDLQQPETCLQ